jgi:hypothetical protein
MVPRAQQEMPWIERSQSDKQTTKTKQTNFRVLVDLEQITLFFLNAEIFTNFSFWVVTN